MDKPQPKPMTCGGCGDPIPPGTARAPYNSLCARCPVPHLLLSRVRAGVDDWRCSYCGQQGPMARLQNTDCTHVYPPCESCGEHPYCAPDCSGIAEVLGADNVYVAGFGIPKH